jgi:GntR family transcriptional regulator / MocR family aminotransferase
MSKILYPSLRLGYLVAPEQLVDSLATIRSVIDQHSPAIDQAILARFITEGFFLSRVKRMRKLYADRRDFFIKDFNKLLSDRNSTTRTTKRFPLSPCASATTRKCVGCLSPTA